MYGGYAKTVYDIGGAVGVWETSESRIESKLTSLSEQITQVETRLLGWLEDNELRLLTAKVLATPKNLRDYSRTADPTIRCNLASELLITTVQNAQLINDNLARLEGDQHRQLYVHYAGLLAINVSKDFVERH